VVVGVFYTLEDFTMSELRTKFLNRPKAGMTVVEIEGSKVGILTPTVQQRESFSTGDNDSATLVAKAIVKLVVDVDTKEPLFTLEDVASMLEQEVGGIIDLFTPEVIKAIQGNRDVKKPI
jgi:recombinational DNA repair ATPase RecF